MNGSEAREAIPAGHINFKKSARLTPRRAVDKECRWCRGGGRWQCESKVCALSDSGSCTLRKIRRHCLDCAGSPEAVRQCEGRVTGGLDGPHICPLHDFRLGTNPRRKGEGGRRGGTPLKICSVPPHSAGTLAARIDDLGRGGT
jgi:hypothetical protein